MDTSTIHLCRICNKTFHNHCELEIHCKRHISSVEKEHLELESIDIVVHVKSKGENDNSSHEKGSSQTDLEKLVSIKQEPNNDEIFDNDESIIHAKHKTNGDQIFSDGKDISDNNAAPVVCIKTESGPLCFGKLLSDDPVCGKIRDDIEMDINENTQAVNSSEDSKCLLGIKIKTYESSIIIETVMGISEFEDTNGAGIHNEMGAEKEYRSQLPIHRKYTTNSVKMCAFPCDNCSKVFPSKNYLGLHIRRMHTTKKLNCKHCGKLFGNTELRRHVKMHHTENLKSYKCDICGKLFHIESYMKSHVLRVHTGAVHNCEICGKCIRDPSNVRRHYKHHSVGKVHICEHCGCSFLEASALRRHLNVHTGVRPYACDGCDAKFKCKSHLKRHQMIHTGETPFKCKVCPEAFITSRQLIVHSRNHSGEKPYQCDVCEKAFTDKGVLKTHMKGHSGDRPYKCDVCDKTFTLRGHLQKHLTTHSEKEAIKCEHCDQLFRHKLYLQRHQNLKFQYKCENCDIAFCTNRLLQSHLKAHRQ